MWTSAMDSTGHVVKGLDLRFYYQVAKFVSVHLY